MRTKTRASRAPCSKPPQPPPDQQHSDGSGSARKMRRRLDWSKRETCIRCGEGGQGLLACQERDCPIAAHPCCLRAEPSLGENGEFYCPFCWYKRQFARVVELRKEVSLARLALRDFLEFKAGDGGGGDRKEEGENQLVEEEEKEEEEEEEKGEGLEESRSDGEARPMRVEERKKENKEAGAGRECVVSPTRKPRQSSKKSGGMIFRGEKRKRLHWTDEEEEKLKEGVQKFSTATNKNLPWRKILEFGRHVFDSTRTPIDLKDKWRNMMTK